jgi:hypothetical protein
LEGTSGDKESIKMEMKEEDLENYLLVASALRKFLEKLNDSFEFLKEKNSTVYVIEALAQSTCALAQCFGVDKKAFLEGISCIWDSHSELLEKEDEQGNNESPTN